MWMGGPSNESSPKQSHGKGLAAGALLAGVWLWGWGLWGRTFSQWGSVLAHPPPVPVGG